ncbi:MAG: DNA mismatch repair endonuclease MutL [Bacteroidales bacterium]|nr:DNA mismatch repair endonuclease MutL [Candidatus Cacconaster caballi]
MLKVLPQNISNLIAAGEVVSRPSAVVKELMENAVDAGARSISVIVLDAGKTLIQVIDDGCGMSAEDAVLCFERHATSKIDCAEDLEKISTYGFRGEALPSIAAIAEVTLKTRREQDETATKVEAAASKIISAEWAAAPKGTSIAVRNIFYNVPARRKFLKSDNVELRNIIQEFTRIALIRTGLSLKLTSQGKEIYNLKPAQNTKQRIRDLFGTNLANSLVPVKVDTTVVKVSGFIGNPEDAVKRQGNQFFFVNGRYFRSPFFHKAVCKPYENLVAPDSTPAYFIFLESEPEKVDVNIHPSKTEVKFEDEPVIFEILMACVRESLGKNDFTPSIDFDMKGAPEIPIFPVGGNGPDFRPIQPPAMGFDPLFNPFNETRFENEGLFCEEPSCEAQADIMVVQKKYIVTPVRSGLMIVNITRARERIFFERYLQKIVEHLPVSQQTLFPVTIDLGPEDHLVLLQQPELLTELGFDIRDFGGNSVVVYGLPENYPMGEADVKDSIDELLSALKDDTATDDTRHLLAARMAKSAAKHGAEPAGREAAQLLVDTLFACREPNLTPDGRKCVTILTLEELDKKL